MQRIVGYVVLIAIAVTAMCYAAFALSPWPSVLLLRHAFDRQAAERNLALFNYVPDGVLATKNLRYGPALSSQLDVYVPSNVHSTAAALPTIVWIHGGAFIAGSKSNVEEYLRVIAVRGYAAVGVDYTLAPTAHYPLPVAQVNEALEFLIANAKQLHVDPSRIVLAGDSAGAQIAAQLATIVSDPKYAAAVGIAPSITTAQLKGVILFCGIYDPAKVDLNGEFGGLLRTAMWAYFGTKEVGGDPRVDQFSVMRHVTVRFPPSFISAGNGDPLEPQSIALAKTLRSKGAAVDTLLFSPAYKPPAQHEYQFLLGTAAGKEALNRVTVFLIRYAGARF